MLNKLTETQSQTNWISKFWNGKGLVIQILEAKNEKKLLKILFVRFMSV